MAARARAVGREARHRRQVAGAARGARGGFSRRQVPTLHGALLSKRVRESAAAEEGQGRQDTQGHSRAGIARSVGGEGGGGGGRARGDEAGRGRQGGARGLRETLAYTDFTMQHWTRIRTDNAIERLNREIRRRTRVVGTFPDGQSALMLVTARLKYIVENEWSRRRYLDVSLLEDEEGKA